MGPHGSWQHLPALIRDEACCQEKEERAPRLAWLAPSQEKDPVGWRWPHQDHAGLRLHTVLCVEPELPWFFSRREPWRIPRSTLKWASYFQGCSVFRSPVTTPTSI